MSVNYLNRLNIYITRDQYKNTRSHCHIIKNRLELRMGNSKKEVIEEILNDRVEFYRKLYNNEIEDIEEEPEEEVEAEPNVLEYLREIYGRIQRLENRNMVRM